MQFNPNHSFIDFRLFSFEQTAQAAKSKHPSIHAIVR